MALDSTVAQEYPKYSEDKLNGEYQRQFYKIIKPKPKNLRKRFFFIASAYAAGATVDTYFSAYGLSTKTGAENNPIIDYLVQKFGVSIGLTIPKALALIGLTYLFHKAYNPVKNPEAKGKLEYYAYPLALILALGGTFSYLKNYFLQ